MVPDVCFHLAVIECETVPFERGYSRCVASSVFDQLPEVVG